MGTIGERIKEERHRLGLNQKAICQAAAISRKTLYNYEMGNFLPNTAFMEALVECGIDRHYVETGQRYGSVLSQELQALRKGTHRAVEALLRVLKLPDSLLARAQEAALAGADDQTLDRLLSEAYMYRSRSEFVFVPHYKMQASDLIIDDQAIVDYLAFKQDWITQSLGCDPHFIALIEVHGDSMSPTLIDKDLTLLDTRPNRSPTDGVYLIQLANTLIFKRLHFKLSGEIEVLTDNPNYKVETLSRRQRDQLMIVGRVVWHGSKI